MPDFLLDLLRQLPVWVIGLILLALMAGGFFVGRWLKRRALANERKTRETSFNGFIVSAVLGLLALLMGFTFSLAIQRFEERRQVVLQEANGIGTAYLRAQLLDAPHRERLSGLLADYTRTQIALADDGYPGSGPLRQHSDAVLTSVWAATVAALDAPRNASLTVALTSAVNNVIDLDATRKNAHEIHIPLLVYDALLIYLVSVSGLLGYEVSKGSETILACFVLVLMSTALMLVLDIDRPTSGAVQESQQPMLELRDALTQQPPAVFDRWRMH